MNYNEIMSNIEPYINLTVAMLGIAYPILLQTVTRLDEKYESEHITALFQKEWASKAYRYTLVASLISVLIWSLNLKPRINIEKANFIIENSATILVITSSILLVFSFFIFVKKVLAYLTLDSLSRYLIKQYEKSQNETKYFQELSDLLIFSIRRQAPNSSTFSDFFYRVFKNFQDKQINKPVEYPEIFYVTVYRAIEELAILKDKRNFLLEKRTSGGIWLIGEFKGKEISDSTYKWLWNNILLAIRHQQDDLIVNHWKTCHQYFSYNLSEIYEEYSVENTTVHVSNIETVQNRKLERNRFLEFHYVLGGLLMYKKRYNCIKRLFDHTQSEPPEYVLLPQTMNDIFLFYYGIRAFESNDLSMISLRYMFPELTGIKADSIIKKWVSSYMAILFLRQYSLTSHFSSINPLDYPQIPTKQIDIRRWIDGLDFFSTLISDHLQDRELLKCLDLNFITSEWCDQHHKIKPLTLIENFKEKLNAKYNFNASNLPIDPAKVNLFKESTNRIIERTFELIHQINNEKQIGDDLCDKWNEVGIRYVQDRDPFLETPESHFFEYDTFLADSLAKKIIRALSQTFIYKVSKTYLLEPNDLFAAIDSLDVDESFRIVNFGINLNYLIEHLKIPELTINSYKNLPIISFSGTNAVNDSLFILHKDDLPKISTLEIDPKIETEYNLTKKSETLNLYTSVIDLNIESSHIFSELEKEDFKKDELKKSVLMTINITTEFKWRKEIQVIQLRQTSDFRQKGIANNIKDINPIIRKNQSKSDS